MLATRADADTAPTVTVEQGALKGSLEQNEAVFRGIPYAAPPIGDLRWKETEPARAWAGVKDATRFGPSCMQNYDFGPTSEDCLSLNIWTPSVSAAPIAVMVWFHGGGDTEGGSNSEFFYGDSLAKKDVVVVSVNYRLNVFGFIALPELSAESPHHASGNYGLLDQIMALKWIKANIAKFGGDPTRVTIFGQSAGAADVERLLVSPLSNGLFQRAIAESGAARRVEPSLAEQEKECGAIVTGMGAPAQNRLAALRRMPATQILSGFAHTQACAPINLDGYVLPEQPLKVFDKGREHPVPFMLGNTLREGFENEMSSDQLKAAIRVQYGDMAERAFPLYGIDKPKTIDPMYGSPTIAWGTDQTHRCRVMLQGIEHSKIAPFYQFEFQRTLPGQSALDRTHSDDVPFVFGVVYNPRYAGTFDATDRKTADQMQTYWSNFAKAGDPNGARRSRHGRNSMPTSAAIWHSPKTARRRAWACAARRRRYFPGRGKRAAHLGLHPERGIRW